MSVQKEVNNDPAKPLGELADEELIALFQNNTESAFGVLVSRYKDPLTNFVFRMLGDRDECEDIVQETFVRVYRNKHAYRPIARFSTWIYTIASNLAKTQMRRRRLRSAFGLRSDECVDGSYTEIPDESTSPDRLTDSALTAERIQRALMAIPAKYREVVVLRDIQEMQYEEIAEVTGMNIGTVKSRINRGRTMLQSLLKDVME